MQPEKNYTLLAHGKQLSIIQGKINGARCDQQSLLTCIMQFNNAFRLARTSCDESSTILYQGFPERCLSVPFA